MAITIDIDTGGTFTDGFVVRDGQPHVVKVLTTPHDLAVCFREVLEAAAQALGTDVPAMLRDTESVRYATTVGTNAVIQRRGPRLGLLAGEDLPSDDGRDWGVGLFVDPSMVTRAQDDGHAVEAIRSLLDCSARGLVCALPDPDDEVRVRETFEAHYPRHCLDAVPLLLGSEITGDADHRRRTATALFNAYVHPDVADYLYRAEDYLRDQGYRRPLLVVHNDGGCARVAKTIAGKTYNSGPTAGLLGARAIARLYGADTLVTLDMGGTSLDVGIVRGGEVPMLAHGLVEDVEISFPLPDLVPLGAGGGSIAWLDNGALRVGPRSAGAKPGPACFGFGGEEPTVTDADVVLGILRPEAFLGGRMGIDGQAARRAVGALAETLGAGVEETAERIRQTVHADMGARLADELTTRGIDPATTTVLAFGGNGATHATGIAQAAGLHDVLTLPFSPVFSAFGASTADVRHVYEARAAEADESAMRSRALRDMRGEGFSADDVEIVVGEQQRDGERWTVLEAVRAMKHLDFESHELTASAPLAPASVSVHWPGHGALDTAIHAGAGLEPGAQVAGPALVEAGETTCAVPPDWRVLVDEYGARRLTFDGEEAR